jgi:hypothetical protein
MNKKNMIYKSLQQKTLQNMIIRELVINFGYDNQLAVADTLAKRVLEIVKEYSLENERVNPGQIAWPAVDINERPGRGKNMAMTKQKTVLLTLVSEEEVRQLSNGHKPRELLPNVIARILLEAEEQGGVLAMNDVAAMMHCSTATVSKAREAWETKHGKILPTRGSLHDMGTTFTHKKQIVGLHLEGYFTSEIARMTNHDPVNVDRYIGDFQRVFLLAQDGQPLNKICFYTGLSKGLVTQYLDFIREKNLLQIQLNGGNKEITEKIDSCESRYPEN